MGRACCIAENHGVFIPGDHGVVLAETILLDSFLGTNGFYSWMPLSFITGDLGVCIPGDHVVLLLETTVFYCWRQWCCIPECHRVLFLGTTAFHP